MSNFNPQPSANQVSNSTNPFRYILPGALLLLVLNSASPAVDKPVSKLMFYFTIHPVLQFAITQAATLVFFVLLTWKIISYWNRNNNFTAEDNKRRTTNLIIIYFALFFTNVLIGFYSTLLLRHGSFSNFLA